MVLYTCDKCDKEFKNKGDYTRHINKKFPCGNGKKVNDNEELSEIVKKLTADMENMKKELTEMKNKEKIVINNNININIVAFGKEDLTFFTEEQKKLLLKRGFKSVETYVELVHFNKNKPEYQNIYIRNIKNGNVVVYDGKIGGQFVKRMDKVFNRLETDQELKNKISDDIKIVLYNGRPAAKK